MGWFLSNKTSKPKKKTKRGKSTDPKWDPKRTLLGMKFAGFAGGAIAIAIGWHYGTQQLEAYVNAEHAQPITAEDVRFSGNQAPLSPAELNHIRAEIAGLIGEAPLNGEGLKQAAERLRNQQDIVRELRQVHRTADGTIEIDLDFREPAALVLMRNERTGELSEVGYDVIDDMGYQMYGPKYLKEVAHLGLPVVLGVNSVYRPKDEQGEYQWQGPEVAAGLALIKELKGTPAIDLIESIAVYDTDERGRIRLWLITKGVGCHILWGLPPGQEKGIEVDPDRKIKLLMDVLRNGNYQTGQWKTVAINTGTIVPRQAISGSRE